MQQWYFTTLIMFLYVCNSVWLACLGNWWASAYWLLATGLTICAVRGLS
jgi:hypothetical protein